MARAYAKRLGADLIVIDKRRPSPNRAEVMNIIGSVSDRNILIVDDLIDTGGTFCSAVAALKENGARTVYGACTHPILSGYAQERIAASDVSKLFITDSIPVTLTESASTKIEARSVATIFAEAIRRGFHNQSISSLFDIDKG